MNDYEFRDKLKECFDGDKGAYNQCMYEFQHRGLINSQLQSNWNSLREWCESWKDNDKYCYLASNDKDKCRYDIWKEVLDKMNELEGRDKE